MMKHSNILHIRRAQPVDLPGVSGLLRQTWHDTYDGLIGRDRVRHLSERWHSIKALGGSLENAAALFLIAEHNGNLAGHALATPSDDGVVLLNRLYVLPKAQGRGIGRQLLRRIETQFAHAPCIRLDVERDNARAIRFYEKQGFIAVDRRNNCLDAEDGIPVVIMEKRLTAR